MAALKFNVLYRDGRSVEVLATPRAQVDTERRFPGLEKTSEVEISFYLAWASLRSALKETAEFEVWLDAIADVETLVPEVVDPTQPTPPPDTSSS